jgi:hypothetical protein
MSREQLLAKPIPGKWSTHQVVCHLADSDLVYAGRIKQVLVENDPTLLNMDENQWVARLADPARDVQAEVEMIERVRKHVGTILRGAAPADYQRKGNHTAAGVLSLETLLGRVTGHIPHHVAFIQEKRKLLG